MFYHFTILLGMLVLQVSALQVQLQSGILSSNDVNHDPFIASPLFSDGVTSKIFLFPWDAKERKGDWYQNLGYCNKYNAEMVTIQSKAENDFFHTWMRSVGMVHPGAWLGAQIVEASKDFEWQNGEPVNFNIPAPGEYNERKLTCLHVGWLNHLNSWWNYLCMTGHMNIVCQKRENYE